MKITLTDKLIAGSDIDLSSKMLGVIHQPKIQDLINININTNNLTELFSVVEHTHWKMSRDIFVEEVPKKFFLAINTERELIENGKENYSLIFILSILYNVDMNDINIDIIDNDIVIYIKNTNILINKDNFDLLLDIVLEMFKIDKKDLHKSLNKEDEWIELSGSAREKEMIEFFKQRDRERKEKERLHLSDYINMVVHIGKYSYEYVLSLTYWQLINTLNSLQNIEKYKEMLGYTWSYKFDIKSEDNPHWIKEIKLEQKTIEI